MAASVPTLVSSVPLPWQDAVLQPLADAPCLILTLLSKVTVPRCCQGIGGVVVLHHAVVCRPICWFAQAAGGGHGAELELLKGITGAFRPGILTALMGAPPLLSQ